MILETLVAPTQSSGLFFVILYNKSQCEVSKRKQPRKKYLNEWKIYCIYYLASII